MTDDPVRWKDDGDAPAGLRALLTEGRRAPPMPAEVRASLLSGLPAPTAAPPSAAPGAGASAATASAAWIAGVVAVVAVAIAAIVWTTRPSPPRTAPSVAPSTPDSSTAPPAEVVTAVPSSTPTASAVTDAATPPPEQVRDTAVLPARRPAASAHPTAAPTAVPSAAPAARSNLAEESVLIGKARAELVASPADALVDIDDHAGRFPHGELAAEREYLRVSALRRLGRNDEARSRGKSYLMLFPTSPYGAPVRTILAELGEP